VVYVLTSGCAWRRLPVTFGIAVPTAYRRFVEWNGVRLWERLYDSVHDVSGNGSDPDDHLVDWARSIRDAAEARAAFAS
jgi:transposase